MESREALDEQKNQQLPPELTLSRMAKKPTSPLNDPVWSRLKLISAGCLAVWLLSVVSDLKILFILWVAAAVIVGSWVVAIRMLLLDSRAKKFWMIWLIAGAIPLIIPGAHGASWASVVSSAIFLLFRRYRPYRHLTSRRQGWLFLLSLIFFILLNVAWSSTSSGPEAGTEEQNNIQAVSEKPGFFLVKGRELLSYGMGSLEIFWLFSFFNLFFNIRLHFMRLRPKLAVSALLIAVFPIFLVIIMGLVILYSLLGESRALRATSIFRDWAEMAVLDEDFLSTLSGRYFSYDLSKEAEGEEVSWQGEEGEWLPEFMEALQANDFSLPELSVEEEAGYFWIKGEVWLVDLSRMDNPQPLLHAWQVDSQMLNRLARILACDVRLYQSNPIRLTRGAIEGEKSLTITEEEVDKYLRGMFFPEKESKPGEGAVSPSLWRRPLYFGMSSLEVLAFQEGKFTNRSIILGTEASLAAITSDLFSAKNPLTQMILVALIAVALVLGLMEALALYFGIRITRGVTQAVRDLHRGTQRLAAGDLGTPIDIPNEDEFGDLAASFNQMAVAVKKGREEAVARERLESELRTAREIQQRLLPHDMPQLPGFEITGTSLPSQQVGGDYFDFVELETGELGIAIADVSGKGIPAALLMANLQASLHAQIIKTRAVSDMVSQMNNLLVRSTDRHMFATFFYGLLDRRNGLLTWANAGHNPPLLFRSGGRLERLEASGLLLGFLPDQPYLQRETILEKGDLFVLYTDGITEATKPTGTPEKNLRFTEEGLIEVVRTNLSKSAQAIQSAILEAVSSFVSHSLQEDDMTLVVIKRT